MNTNQVITTGDKNPNKDHILAGPPTDSVSSLVFSPPKQEQTFLIAGSWDNSVRCWEITQSGSIPRLMQNMGGPVLDVCWSDDGTKVFMASCDQTAKIWDLATNQTTQVAAHLAPIKTCHWIQGGNYSCLMTGSWDKTLKFWDTRTPTPVHVIALDERIYCADVEFPVAAIGTASKQVHVYNFLPARPTLIDKISSAIKAQQRCVALYTNKDHQPCAFAAGTVLGRVCLEYFGNDKSKNFQFKCHRHQSSSTVMDVYIVNGIKVHPTHGTLATVGSDGTFGFWDKDARIKLMASENVGQSLTACDINHTGHVFAYAAGYDWSKGHEFNTPDMKPAIYLRPCFEEMKKK